MKTEMTAKFTFTFKVLFPINPRDGNPLRKIWKARELLLHICYMYIFPMIALKTIKVWQSVIM